MLHMKYARHTRLIVMILTSDRVLIQLNMISLMCLPIRFDLATSKYLATNRNEDILQQTHHQQQQKTTHLKITSIIQMESKYFEERWRHFFILLLASFYHELSIESGLNSKNKFICIIFD